MEENVRDAYTDVLHFRTTLDNTFYDANEVNKYDSNIYASTKINMYEYDTKNSFYIPYSLVKFAA